MAVSYSIHRRFVKAESWFNEFFIMPLQKLLGMAGDKKTIVGKKPHLSQKEELFKILETSSISKTCKDRIKEELKSSAKHDKKSARRLWKQYKEILTDSTLSASEKEAFILGLSKASAYLNSKKVQAKLKNKPEDNNPESKKEDRPNVEKSYPSAVLDHKGIDVLLEWEKWALTADSMPLPLRSKGNIVVQDPQPLTFGFTNHRTIHQHRIYDPASFPQRVMEKPQQRDDVQALPQKSHHKFR